MKTQSCKAKGRKLQQEVVASIKGSFPQLTGNDVKSVAMGSNGEDIVMSPLAEAMFPYSVECKNVERLNIWKAVEQAEANVERGKIPILAIRKNRTRPLAVVPWEHFMTLVQGRGVGTATEAPVEVAGGDKKRQRANDDHPDEGPSRAMMSEADVRQVHHHIEALSRLLPSPPAEAVRSAPSTPLNLTLSE